MNITYWKRKLKNCNREAAWEKHDSTTRSHAQAGARRAHQKIADLRSKKTSKRKR